MISLKFLLLVLIVLISSPRQTNSGFVSDRIGEFFGNIVDKTTEGVFDRSDELMNKAKGAFRESMDVLFDEKIKPMIYELQSMIDRAMGQVDDLIQKSIDHLKNSINEIVNNAAQRAKELIDHTIEQIKEKIIDESFAKATELENKIFGDIMVILNKVDETILKISCSAQAIEVRIREDLYKLLPTIPNPWSSCRISIDEAFPGLNLRYKLLSQFNSNQLYELKKCYLLDQLTEKTEIQSILLTYRDLELLAAGMRCYSISVGAVENQKYYIREMGHCSKVIETYSELIGVQGRLKFLALY